jgi:uncharacterized protein HemX
MTEKHSDTQGPAGSDGPADDARSADVNAAPRSQLDTTGSATEVPRAEPADTRISGINPVNVLALALAFFAAAAAGFLWWQYRQFYVALDDVDGQTILSLQDLRATVRRLEDELETLDGRAQQTADTTQRISERVETYPPRFADMEQRLAAAQGVSSEARELWLRAQAEYFLVVANTELSLREARGAAVTALELADDRLVELGNPAFAGVREQIAAELLALRGMRVADIEGLSYSLGRLAARVPELPLRSPAPRRYATPGAAAAELEPGLARLWQSFKNAMSGMVSVERRQAADAYPLSRDDQTLVVRQLELELTIARLGLVQGMADVYRASMSAALSLLEAHFLTDQAAVEGAVTLLEEMLSLDVAPRYPDITRSLELLRNVPNRDG